jgi:hypothetical protein
MGATITFYTFCTFKTMFNCKNGNIVEFEFERNVYLNLILKSTFSLLFHTRTPYSTLPYPSSSSKSPYISSFTPLQTTSSFPTTFCLLLSYSFFLLSSLFLQTMIDITSPSHLCYFLHSHITTNLPKLTSLP